MCLPPGYKSGLVGNCSSQFFKALEAKTVVSGFATAFWLPAAL
nr:MAG TPA: hypothetical protein [Caudoviricetes sp.]